jgi:hypothetical protein
MRRIPIMAKYKDKQSGAVVEAARVANPNHAQRKDGVEPMDWSVTDDAGKTTYVKPVDFVERYELQP